MSEQRPRIGTVAEGPERPAGDDRRRLRKPDFLKRPLGGGPQVRAVKRLLRDQKLLTVCEVARCPNLGECFEGGTATFLILGSGCSRACGFCAVGGQTPEPPEPPEPVRTAEAAERLGLDHVVITSVTRDDLPDGGAGHFVATVDAVRALLPGATIEVLTPDFGGDLNCVRRIASSSVDVFNHNVETVPRLYSKVRPDGSYDRSLSVLHTVAVEFSHLLTKSGLMVGLGEKSKEVLNVLSDMARNGVEMVTIGQYLRPSLKNLPVEEYDSEEVYQDYRSYGLQIGLRHVFAGPFVRSSYHAGEVVKHISQASEHSDEDSP